MKKYILIIVIIVIIVAVLGSIYYYYLRNKPPEDSSDKGEEQIPELIFYADEEWGFEFNYPADWEEQSLTQREGMVSFAINAPIEEESGGSAASFFILAFNPTEGQVFSVEMENSIEQVEAAGILISQSQRTIADSNALELAYVDKPVDPESKQLHYFIDQGNTWYQLLYTAKQDKFDEYLPEIEKMIESFRITK
ncbi:hypothetical protein AMJ47_01085 [Parcubacteria bacterium DG_72]|nr:MAG: hypothetical protein AMJ47_01085 [Parcubacteria bacterium DG_72]